MKVAGLAGSKAPREDSLRHPPSRAFKTIKALMACIVLAPLVDSSSHPYKPCISPSAKTSGCEFLRTGLLNDYKSLVSVAADVPRIDVSHEYERRAPVNQRVLHLSPSLT